MEELLNFRTLSDRLKTFENWPHPLISKQRLAEAGFYYTNVRDTVRCEFCGIEGYRWEEDDDPFLDHASWSPNCPYVVDRRAEAANPVLVEPTGNPDRTNHTSVAEDSEAEVEDLTHHPEIIEAEAVVEDLTRHSEVIEDSEDQANTRYSMCKICYMRIIEYALIPCGHLVFCGDCSSKLEFCPLCRHHICNRLRIYMP